MRGPEGQESPEAIDLVRRAREARERAYAPYSRFPVGAAVVDELGRTFTGANVENASYGLTMCAERVAIFSAVAAGARGIKAMAVSAQTHKPVSPCGACRQVLAEFCKPSTPVYSDAGESPALAWTARNCFRPLSRPAT